MFHSAISLTPNSSRKRCSISAKEAQSERLANFIKTLKAQDGIITDFDGSLWGGMLEFVTVGRDKEITVTFRDGTEILA